MQFSYQVPIGKKENWSFFTAQGLQISILTNYYSIRKDYKVDIVNNGNTYITVADMDEWVSSFIQTPTKRHQQSKNTIPSDTYYDFDSPAYRRFVLGYSSSYGFQRKLGKRFIASLATRFDFDFTNADNVDGMFEYTTASMITWDENFSKDNRPVSHNIRLGLELGVRYIFGFKKRKAKLCTETKCIEE